MSLQVNARTCVRTDVDLKYCTTFRIGGKAKYFAEPKTPAELSEILAFKRETGLALFVLGRGSNLLFSDNGYSGIVLSLRKFGTQEIRRTAADRLKAEASVDLLKLSLACREYGLGGAEFLCHIPGTVGGAAATNAGFGRPGSPRREMGSILSRVTVMTRAGEVREMDSSEIAFEYRDSGLRGEYIVLDAEFQLEARPRAEIHSEIRANFDYRNSVQDLSAPSAGSIFKNPEGCKLSSGGMLDFVGMKGVRVEGAVVSRKHANFILNTGDAGSEDVLHLMAVGKKRVYEEFGVELEAEVEYIAGE